MRLTDILLERAPGTVAINSLGRPIAATPEGLQRFWQWFGKSKAVDREGRPLVLFHGTTADFRSFDPKMSNSNTGTGVPRGAFVFTNSTDAALSYAGQSTKPWDITDPKLHDEYMDLITNNEMSKAIALFKKHAVKDVKWWDEGGNVMPVYLRMLKPMKVSARGNNWDEIEWKRDFVSTNDLMSDAKAQGYDGLIVTNVHDRQEGKGKTANTYAVFSPTQIKSAIGNRGGFDPESHHIDEDG